MPPVEGPLGMLSSCRVRRGGRGRAAVRALRSVTPVARHRMSGWRLLAAGRITGVCAPARSATDAKPMGRLCGLDVLAGARGLDEPPAKSLRMCQCERLVLYGRRQAGGVSSWSL